MPLIVEELSVDRPISPHLTIYKPQVTSVMSVLHRASVLVSIAALLWLSLLFIAAPYGEQRFEAVAGIVCSWHGKVLLAFLALSLFYHLCNGIRHLAWDTARGLTMPAIRSSAVWVLAAAVVLTLLVLIV